MKINWIEFSKGFGFGLMITAMLFTGLAHIRDAAVIKLYQDGKIECATVGGDFICREVDK